MFGTYSRILSLGLIILLLLPGIISAENIKSNDIQTSSEPESHLIEGVPYVGQYDNFHCAFATKTMMVNYFEKNTTLEEIIYLMGNAYSLGLSKNSKDDRIPYSGIGLSQSPKDSEFIAELFGLAFDCSYKGNKFSVKQEYWDTYWAEVKENISQNIPIEVCVAPYNLPSIQNLFELNGFIWNKTGGGHAIVIVGYNESNQTVCYNDPLMLLYGNPSFGTYDWMSIGTFKNAVESAGIKYEIQRFQNVTNQKIKSEIIQIAHLNNIEKMKGNSSVYGTYIVDLTENSFFGINASEKLNDFYEKGFNNRFKTILRYKLNGKLGVKYSIITAMGKKFPYIFDSIPYSYDTFLQNTFDLIAIEKAMTAEYLKNSTILPEICNYDSSLLMQESENWTKISNYYSEFMKKGIFMSLPRALILMNKMEETMENIIAIEEAIIAGPSD